VLNDGFDLPLSTALQLEALHFAVCCASKDKSEGVTAFLEKRVAQFHGD
jgi:enoyl-CoA hydratase